MATVVVIGGHRWGSGPTLPEAKKRFRREGGSLGYGYVVLMFPDGAEFFGLDEAGRYHYRGDAPAIQEIAARTPTRARR